MFDTLLLPPVAFVIILILVGAFATVLSFWAFRNKNQSSGARTAYSCGEEMDDHMIQPDYSQFFPFAFFFTILHVVVLVITTVPETTISIFYIAMLYIICAVVGLIILLRR